MTRETRKIRIDESTQIGEARRASRSLCETLGLPEDDKGRVAIIVNEAASNLVKHTKGKGGELLLNPIRGGIEILALDHGPGMSNPMACAVDGYSTSGTNGLGLGGIRRLSDHFDIYSLVDVGTALYSRVTVPTDARMARTSGTWDIGGISIALDGEEVCGDAWDFSISKFATSSDSVPSSASILVADGLGHGPRARAAAIEAVETFNHIQRKTSPAEPVAPGTMVMKAIHESLRKSRGAAVAVLEMDIHSHRLNYTGIGNIAASIHGTAGKAQGLVSLNGIAGHECRKIQSFQYEMAAQSVVIAHSDGLLTRWDLSAYPGLLGKPATLIASVLYRDFKRGKDDVTVIAAKSGARSQL